MELTFDQIIDRIIEKTGKLLTEISSELGYKEYYLSQLRSRIKKGVAEEPKNLREAIFLRYGYVFNEDKKPDQEGDSKIFQVNPFLTSRQKQGKTPVKYYDVDFQAGSGIVFYEDNVEFPAYEMNIPAFSGCVAFNVFGESMEPLIKNGSVCFGRKKENWHEYLEYGQIYGIIMKNGHDRYLKYIRKHEDDKYFLLKSANPEFDPFPVPKKDIHNIWLIEGWMLKRT